MTSGETTDPIGQARMTEDRSLELTLRAEGPSGELGDAFFVYAPNHDSYDEVLAHLEAAHGKLEPGASVSVPAWPDP